ncbi:MAG: hypothetical protein HYV07_19200 [Deltaproteobacteria bacterium]|nr:hypothetical protein [Deltaproteobacteria bacterium]
MSILLALLATVPCDSAVGTPSIGFEDGALGRPVGACPSTGFDIEAGGHLLADTDHFYGNVRAVGRLTGRLALDDRASVFLELEAVRYQTVISSLSASDLGLGFAGVGGTWMLGRGDAHHLGLWVRLVLPTAFGLFEERWPFSADLGFEYERRLSELFRAHAHAGVLATISASKEPLEGRLGLAAGIGAEVTPLSWLSVALDAELLLGRHDPLDHVALSVAVRLRASDRDLVELAAISPLAGEERQLLSAALRYRRTL